MVVAIMQPYLFPYIGYFQLINAVDKFVIYDDVNYINKGWINRNNILVNGKANLFTVPLKEASQNKLINEIALSDDDSWRTKFIKTLEQNYKKAPYFTDVLAVIKNLIESDIKKISDFNLQALKSVCSYLSIQTQFISSSDIYENTHLKGQERILDICITEGANQYINPIGGMELYQKELFEKNNINLNFIKSKSTEYKQSKQDFVPWLSIIDVMMFCSPSQIGEMLTQYELV